MKTVRREAWSPTGKARSPHFTPQWGDIPAKGWCIHPRPKAVVFCCRGKSEGLRCMSIVPAYRRQVQADQGHRVKCCGVQIMEAFFALPVEERFWMEAKRPFQSLPEQSTSER